MSGLGVGPDSAVLRAIRTTPIIDNHAHPLLRSGAFSKHALLAVATEASGDALADSRTGLAHFRAVRQLAGVLGCEPTWEAVTAAVDTRRAGDHGAWITRCMDGIETVLVDDGLDNMDDVESYDFFDTFTPSHNKRIVRIEQFLPGLIDKACLDHDTAPKALAAVVKAFSDTINQAIADPEVVGFKSVICYRTGLAIPRVIASEELVAIMERVHSQRRQAGASSFSRLNHRPMNEFFVHLLAKLIRDSSDPHKKPIQFHTGLGDNDITLTKSSPSHMQEFIREYPTVPIVLLHASYPFTREAGYLAAMYANVYSDIGEIFPFVSRDGQEVALRQILELCPSSKILWSTDGHWFPETYLLAVDQMREVMGDVLSGYVQKGDLTEAQAVKLVEDVLFNNSNKLYNLGLTLRKIPSPSRAEAHRTGSSNLQTLLSFLDGKDTPRFLRIPWSDMTASYRTRVIPMRRVFSMLQNGEDFSFGVTKASMGLVQTDLAVKGVSPVGEWRLHPDLSSLRLGPRPGHVVAMGDFKEKDGSPVGFCSRTLLKKILGIASQHGLEFSIGFELELVLLRRTSNGFAPLDGDGHAWGVSRALEHKAAITVIEEAVEQLDTAGIFIEIVHPESANGQYEFVLPQAQPLEAVDALLHARDIISSCATAAGYRMTLHPKPVAMACGTAAHMHMSISSPGGSSPKVYEPFYAGILRHLRAICAFTYSNPTSYERVQDGCWAGGTWATWGTENREVPLRKVEDSHWEVRNMDGLANPYLALAAILGAGVRGFVSKTALTWEECTVDPSALTAAEREKLGIRDSLPRSLEEALQALESDDEMEKVMGEELVQRYVLIKRTEIDMLKDMSTEDLRQWIMERY